jgi:hypothetical protein
MRYRWIITGVVGMSGALLACSAQETRTAEAAAGGSGQAGAAGATGQGGGAGGEWPITGDKCKFDADGCETTVVNNKVPPGPPMAAVPTGEPPAIQAVSKLFLGDTDRTGAASHDAWKSYGFDLDGVRSTEANPLHCQAVAGAKKKDIREDGEGGIDNSFGRNIVDIIKGISSDPSTRADLSIQQGSFSLLLALDQLGTSTDYTGIQTRLFVVQGPTNQDGESLPPTPTQLASGTYTWHPFAEQLTPDGAARTVFPASYLVGDTLVSSVARSEISIELPIAGVRLPVVVHQAWLSVKLAPDHRSGTEGNLGGILDTEEFLASFQKFAGTINTGLCTVSTLDSLTTQLRQASDILRDSTQDPTKVCDGISIGLGFATGGAVLGDPAPPTPATPNPCP